MRKSILQIEKSVQKVSQLDVVSDRTLHNNLLRSTMDQMRIVSTIIWKFLFILVLFIFTPSSAQAADYYVSKNGNNANGTSWATAWNELNQISWATIAPGDTIHIDGGSVACDYPTYVTGVTAQPKTADGSDCGMVYTTMLTPTKSGTAGNPVTIQLSTEANRNGTAIFFGGRSLPAPYCNQVGYSYTAGLRRLALFENVNYVTLDGTKWGGIKIYGGIAGVSVKSTTTDITVKHVEIFDNSNAMPDIAGVELGGTNGVFERVIIHDNGQDAFQSGSGVTNFTLRQSWLFNQRAHPSVAREPFNYCRHTDGLQIYGGGDSYGVNVEDSILGPGFMQPFILGDHASSTSVATVHNFSLKNSLLVGYHGGSNNANIYTKYSSTAPNPNNAPTGYTIDNVTSYIDVRTTTWNIFMNGSNHTVTDSIFHGGREIRVDGNPTVSNNIRYEVADFDGIASIVDPQFTDNNFGEVGAADYFNFDFTSTANPGKGSCIGSPEALFSLKDGEHCPGQVVDPTPCLAADINEDGIVDLSDYSRLVDDFFKTSPSNPRADINEDGIVDLGDYSVLVSQFFRTAICGG